MSISRSFWKCCAKRRLPTHYIYWAHEALGCCKPAEAFVMT